MWTNSRPKVYDSSACCVASIPLRSCECDAERVGTHRRNRRRAGERLGIEGAEQAGAGVVSEGHGVAVQHPQHTDNGHAREAHHQHVHHTARVDHAAVEQC